MKNEYTFDISDELMALSDGFLDHMHQDQDLQSNDWLRIAILDPEWKRRRDNPSLPPTPITIPCHWTEAEVQKIMLSNSIALSQAHSLLKDAPFALNPDIARQEFQSQVNLWQAVRNYLTEFKCFMDLSSNTQPN